jgi:hypothetical protein
MCVGKTRILLIFFYVDYKRTYSISQVISYAFLLLLQLLKTKIDYLMKCVARKQKRKKLRKVFWEPIPIGRWM